jgi:hypothetical protein
MRFGLVILADILKAVKPVPEHDGGRLNHAQIEVTGVPAVESLTYT